MKKFLCFLGLTCLLMSWPGIARAEGESTQQWTGVEVLTMAQTEVSIFRASTHYFWIPEAGVNLFFAYAGPKLKLGDWGWIAPQVGVAGNWKDETDFVDVSIWAFGSYKDFSLFLEADYIFALGMDPDLYTFGSADYGWSLYNMGIHSEGVNDAFGVGPHVGVTPELGDGGLTWHGEIQYYFKPPSEGDIFGHAMRAVNSLSF